MAFTGGVNSFTANGPQSMFWAVANNGLPYGTTGVLANGASAGMADMVLVKSLDITEPDSETIYPTGNNGYADGYILEPNTGPTGTLTQGGRDQLLYVKSTGMKIATSNGRDLIGLGPLCRAYGQLQFLINSPAKSLESASMGENGFVVNGLMNVQSNTKGFTPMTERAVRDWVSNLVLSRSSKTLWGESWVDITHGSTAFIGFEFPSPYPIHIMTFIGDGSTDEVELDKPLAEASATNVQVWRAGTGLVYTTAFTADTTANSVSFVAAPTAASVNIIVYGYVPSC